MTTPRRALPPEEGRVVSGGPRRGLPAAEPERDSRATWLALAVLAVLLAVAVVVLYATVGARRDASPSPLPGTPPPSASPTASADPTGAETTEATPPATVSPSAPATSSPPPSPSPSPAALDLGDAVVVVPDAWEVYADQLVQDSRRLVRLRDPATDVRVQVVTLTTVTGELDQACRDLVTEQSTGFSGVATSLVVDVPVGAGATAVSCAFTGTRVSDGVPNKTEFTLLRRTTDAQTLVFRDTIPSVVRTGDPALAALTAMECAAAESFGVSVQSC